MIVSDCPYCGSAQTTHYLKTTDYFLTKEPFDIDSCLSCGLRFTTPRPDSNTLGAYYNSDKYISHDDSNSGIIGVVYKKVRNYALYNKERLVKKQAQGKNVLDFGCGSGAFLYYLKNKNWIATGVEYDDKTREKVIRSTGVNVQKEIHALKKGSFDIITAWHVMEHVYNIKETFIGLNSLLTKKGKLIIAVPNHKSPDAQFYKEFWAALDVPRHLYHFDVDSMTKITSETGFKLIEIKPMLFDSFYISLVSTQYKYGTHRPLEAFWQGLISNMKANKQTPNHSSLIYILEKTA